MIYNFGWEGRIQTGNKQLVGSQPAQIMVGVIAGASEWIDPLIDLEDQNALYQADAQEDEGMGFGYVNTKFGVPWLVVRGITDSAWYPDNYDGLHGADNAALVAEGIIQHLPSTKALRQNATYSMLSADSNAKMNGYIVANKVYISPDGQVAEVEYTNQAGKAIDEKNPNELEYTYPAG